MSPLLNGRFRRATLAAIAILLAIAIPPLWRLRPLNSLERRLAGDWQNYYGLMLSPSPAFTLRPDRTFQIGQRPGHWHAANGRLFLSYSFWPSLRQLPGPFWNRLSFAWSGAWAVAPEKVIFDEMGHVKLSYGTYRIFPVGTWSPETEGVWLSSDRDRQDR